MLRRYPSIARRFPRRKSVAGRPIVSETNVEASNQPRYEVRMTIDPVLSSEASVRMRDSRDGAVMSISDSDGDQTITFRDDPASAKISAEGSPTFSG